MFESYDILTRQYDGADKVRPRTLGLARFFEQIGRVIHRANPRLLIFFTEQKSRTTGAWWLMRRPSAPNGAMTTEFYENFWDPSDAGRLGQHLLWARTWGYPLWVAEFDAFHKSSGSQAPLPGWRTKTSAILAYSRRHQISWSLLGYAAGRFMVQDDLTTAKPSLLATIRDGF